MAKARRKKAPALKKPKREPLKFDSGEKDPIIDHLRECCEQFPSSKHINIDDEILDQIALEGLSGIKFAHLLRLLDAILPNLNCTTDENCQSYIWSVITERYLSYPTGNCVRAFYLEEVDKKKKPKTGDSPASSSQPSSPQKGLFIDKQFELPQSTLKRFAKFDSLLCPIQDELIMGSCASYLERQDITQEVIELAENHKALESMYEVQGKYGLSNVFFVADQTLRSRAIFPNWADPNVDIKLREYCVLELIGKSRTFGTIFPKHKTLGRYRIMLLSKGFITQYQETNSRPIEHHLKRFSHVRSQFKTAITQPCKQAELSSDDDDEYSLEDKSKSVTKKFCCDPEKLRPYRGVLVMLYDAIAESMGKTKVDLRRELHMPNFHLRNHMKNLVALELICSHTVRGQDKVHRVYRTVHRSIRRKKKIKESLPEPTGIMAKWDEADRRAKKIIGHKRSSFSQAEDSLLILCRIASILIEPGCKLSWCVHKHLVRDLLHEELIESHNKTSDACLRRIKYLKRLPNNIMSINELTAELQDDHDIRRLLQADNKLIESDNKMKKLFIQVLKTVRAKIPNLLGVTAAVTTTGDTSSSGSSLSNPGIGPSRLVRRQIEEGGFGLSKIGQGKEREHLDINDHQELKEKFELVDCQSVASIVRSPTYERAKNLVDVKFNNASLVTMASALSSCLASSSESPQDKRGQQWLLDKFYSTHPDKLISSVLSKLNKRSLLTRKSFTQDQAPIYKPARTKMSVKLNQSVLFLLTRNHSASLMQLAHPISQLYKIELSESNDMSSIALLTSLCSMSLFNLNLKLKIPNNVVGIDQGNENFKSLCERADEERRAILARFMSRCGDSLSLTATATAAATTTATPALPPTTSGQKPKQQQDQSRQQLTSTPGANNNNKMDDSRRALFLLRHELKSQALDKCGSLSDCLIVQPCNMEFSSQKELKLSKEPMEMFLEKAKPLDLIDVDQQQQKPSSLDWLVKSFRFREGVVDSLESDLEEAPKVPVEFSARLWKRIDGNVHLSSLFKLIESILAWTIVFPGIELGLLEREIGHLMPSEHLLELLELMERLELITSHKVLAAQRTKPLLFGYKPGEGQTGAESQASVTYESTPSAYATYCQLLNYTRDFTSS